MPLYDYQCRSGNHLFEVRQTFAEAGSASCPVCGSDSQRVFHSVPILFKGSGFYSTDHRKGAASYTSNGKEEKSEEKSESKSESKAEAKSESKSESKATDKPKEKTSSKTES